MGKYLLHYDNMTQFMTEQENQNQYVKSIVPGVAYVESGETVHYNEIPKWKTISVKFKVSNAGEVYSLVDYFDAEGAGYSFETVSKDNWTQYLKAIKINGTIIDPTIASVGSDDDAKMLAYEFSATGIYDIDYVLRDEIPASFLNEYRVIASCGYNCYKNDGNLEIVISSGFTKIPVFCFGDSDILTAITIPEGIEEIAGNSLTGMEVLSSITLPSTLRRLTPGTSGNNEVFSRCTTAITCLATTAPELSENSLYHNSRTNGTLYYPAGSDYSTWLTALNANGYTWTGVEI